MSKAEQMLRDLGVTKFYPGFMDEPAFLKAEEKNPMILALYAAYIKELKLPETYLVRSKERIQQLVQFLYPLLVKEGRLGACVDASMAMSRMLDREGIWNYCMNGGLTIIPDDEDIPTGYFAPITDQRAAAPHGWVVAPPFHIIDLTVKLQPMKQDLRGLLPDYVAAEEVKLAEARIKDWIDPPYYPTVRRNLGREPRLDDLPRLVRRDTLIIMTKFGCWDVREEKVTLRYLANGIGGSIEPLGGMRNLKFGGMWPAAAYEEFLKQHPASG